MANNEHKKTLVLGASKNPERYSFIAINRLRKHGHPVIAVGKREAVVADVPIGIEKEEHNDIDTVTLYLSAQNQKQYYDYIIGLHPKRIIFNPGAENDELYDMAEKAGIKPIEACTLVMLSTGQY
ncbi:MAG: CoA-binding protein [Chitinophagaceae bacterium]|nr:MAG: CoA-binding protein [Chitinophagaceae bacterium]